MACQARGSAIVAANAEVPAAEIEDFHVGARRSADQSTGDQHAPVGQQRGRGVHARGEQLPGRSRGVGHRIVDSYAVGDAAIRESSASDQRAPVVECHRGRADAGVSNGASRQPRANTLWQLRLKQPRRCAGRNHDDEHHLHDAREGSFH